VTLFFFLKEKVLLIAIQNAKQERNLLEHITQMMSMYQKKSHQIQK
jgi:hypothetical protein